MDAEEQNRIRRTERKVVRVEESPFRIPSFLGRVVTSAPAVGKFLLAQPLELTGTELEGSTGITTNSGSTAGSIPVYLMGPGVPAMGDELLCRHVNHRWIAHRRGTPGGGGPGYPTVSLLNCACPALPVSIAFTGGTGSFCNVGEFAPCTIVYGPTPSSFTDSLGPNSFLSTVDFVDTPAGGTMYRFLLSCDPTTIRLSRIYYPADGVGSYVTSVRYSWPVAAATNSCSPFSMNYGVPYSGGNPACKLYLNPS